MTRGSTHAERVARFGEFAFRPAPTTANPEAVIIDPAWCAANLRTVLVPELQRRVTMHRDAVEPFRELVRAWQRAGLLAQITSWDGWWAPRFKRGRTGGAEALSNHAWGTAFDVCARENPLGSVPAPRGAKGSVVEHAAIAAALGWAWGGSWSRPDPMHFELGRTSAA